jgi:hypothetical protein
MTLNALVMAADSEGKEKILVRPFHSETCNMYIRLKNSITMRQKKSGSRDP